MEIENGVNGELRIENGEWRMENGEWGKWRMENGEWRIENGELAGVMGLGARASGPPGPPQAGGESYPRADFDL
jgi:hypothetical protein